MSAPVVAFFGLKGGQGKTTLVYHLTWMFSDLGVPVLAADLDPQCELTQRFLGPDATAALAASGQTIYSSFRRLVDGRAAPDGACLVHPGRDVALFAGDVSLFELEAVLADAFRPSTTGEGLATTLLGFRSLFAEAAKWSSARMVLVDVASNGGFINRAALAAADYFIVPVVPDVFAVKNLRFIGELLD